MTKPALPPGAKPSVQQPTVVIIDDDAGMRSALRNLLESVDFRVEVFASPAEFLERTMLGVASCLVLDVRLPGPSGLDFQADLTKANISIPIIFITGHGDIPMTVKAMKAGAIEFLTKPFRDQEILDAVRVALEYDRKRRETEESLSDLRSRFESLTPRELEVVTLVASGLMNKQIAFRMGIAEITVKIHRMQIMRKLGAKSLADLVRMTDRFRGFTHQIEGQTNVWFRPLVQWPTLSAAERLDGRFAEPNKR